jgi:stalled ribosome rescue protein Dom34
MKGNYDFLKNKNNKEKYMAVVTYIAFVTNYCLELINSKDNIIISGPLINNNDFLKVLNSLRPKQKIYLSSNQETTAIGASLLCNIKKKINTKLKIYKHKKIDNTFVAYKKWLLNFNN